MAERIIQLIPAPAGSSAYYCTGIDEYRGGAEIPLLVGEPVVAFALMEDGSKTFVEAMVLDEDEGGLMRVSELPSFFGVGSDEGRAAGQKFYLALEKIRKRYPAPPKDTKAVEK